MTGFGDRLAAAMTAHGPVCVGIDPHPHLLASWGLGDDAEGLRRFGTTVVERLAGRVAAVKPQSAFFERHGAAGIAALEEVLAAARGAGLLSILDVKRGDIGSTMAGYAQAYLAEDAPLRADAVTLTPYLGLESLRPALDLAHQTGRGVFVLALTSNAEAPPVQHARYEGEAVAAGVAAAVGEENRRHPGEGLGSVGLVVGATVGSAPRDLGIDLSAVRGPLLAPGVGAQGAGAAEIAEVFGPARRQVLASSSREVLGAGPDGLAEAVARFAETVRTVSAR